MVLSPISNPSTLLPNQNSEAPLIVTLRSIIYRVAIVAYCIVTLPLVFISLKSEYVRYVAIQMATNWKGLLTALPAAYVGDSITAGGRNWGDVLGAINLAGDGYTVSQIECQLGKALKYSPRRIFILAGTNDILGPRPLDLKQFELDYSHLLDHALKLKAEVFVTLIPLTSREGPNRVIPSANQIIQSLTRERGIITINLNPIIAPHGTLLPQYTVDGVHFTNETYKIWRHALAKAVRHPVVGLDPVVRADKLPN